MALENRLAEKEEEIERQKQTVQQLKNNQQQAATQSATQPTTQPTTQATHVAAGPDAVTVSISTESDRGSWRMRCSKTQLVSKRDYSLSCYNVKVKGKGVYL